jgi:hypothetical protein
MSWTTPSKYEPNREARAHLAAAKRNPRKAKQHVQAAEILMQVPTTDSGEFNDHNAVSAAWRNRAAKKKAFDEKALGVTNVEST